MFKVYYTDPADNKCYSWDCSDLKDALYITESFRSKGMTFVTMVSENPNLVGKAGVAGVVDGTLPNGEKYEYTKRDALSQRTKLPPVSTDNIEVELDDPH